MAKAVYTVTTNWQQIATGPVVLTIKAEGDGVIMFDEAQDDATAYVSSADVGDQFEQAAAVPTYVKATGDGWKVIADGTL
jgi:hypothetical protein